MGDELTLEELSRSTGEPVERLSQWRSLGLIGAEGSEGFRPEDVEVAGLVQLLLRRGIGLEAIAKADREQRFLGHYLELMFPEGVTPSYSLAEAAEMAGLEVGVARRFWEAVGLTEQGEMAGEEDITALRALKSVLQAGFPEEPLIQVMRVWADALGRVAEAGQRSFHFYVHERLKASGMSAEELMAASDAISQHAVPQAEPTLLYLYRKGVARANREDMVMHAAEDAGLVEISEVPGQLQAAIVFVDLSSFTPLAEAMGDVKAAEVLERFSALVRQAAAHWDGRVVKQIGDAFLLVFPESRTAVACVLEIEARTAGEPQFPAARSGVHWGSVLYREGDYVGSNVNIASRVAAEAGRHQVLVTSAVRKEAKGLAEVEFVRLGKRRLKGLAEELELFEARPVGAEEREKAVDPVCGMELGPGEAAATLTMEGEERAFCSDECLRRFVAAPEKYSG
ncbi:MAG: YHS domain-containing protein [Chloroflexi bacterium]|nr:YHS domain-containing protein [Chloroflexota bacterium]